MVSVKCTLLHQYNISYCYCCLFYSTNTECVVFCNCNYRVGLYNSRSYFSVLFKSLWSVFNNAVSRNVSSFISTNYSIQYVQLYTFHNATSFNYTRKYGRIIGPCHCFKIIQHCTKIIRIHFKNLQECEEVQNEKCQQKDVKVPKQIKEHKKKCLLPDDNALPAEATTTAYIHLDDPVPATTSSSSLNANYPKIDRMDDNIVRYDSSHIL